MRSTSLRSLPALLLVAAASAGCSRDTETTNPVGDPSSSPASTSSTTDEPAEEGPVAGAGADVDPADAEAWCGAVSAGQLSSLTGHEVDEVRAGGEGLQTCVANFPGSELLLTWGSDPTGKSFEEYAARFDKPAGVYDSEVITLDGGQRVVLAPRPDSSGAFAGTVVDGRAIQVAMGGVVVQDTDSDDLAEMARQVLATYVA